MKVEDRPSPFAQGPKMPFVRLEVNENYDF
jgi:hypothetical protein